MAKKTIQYILVRTHARTVKNGDKMCPDVAEDKYDLGLQVKMHNKYSLDQRKSDPTYKKWWEQTEDKFGFIPLGPLVMPSSDKRRHCGSNSIKLYDITRNETTFNFLSAQIQLDSQLNADMWEKLLENYWDQQGYDVINFFDDIIGFDTISTARPSFDALTKLLQKLGLDISIKKLVQRATKVTCLGVEVDTENFTVAIPNEKVLEILQKCHQWTEKNPFHKKGITIPMVSVLNSGKTQDLTLAAFAKNIMMEISEQDIDLLSRWFITNNPGKILSNYVHNPMWLHLHTNIAYIDWSI